MVESIKMQTRTYLFKVRLRLKPFYSKNVVFDTICESLKFSDSRPMDNRHRSLCSIETGYFSSFSKSLSKKIKNCSMKKYLFPLKSCFSFKTTWPTQLQLLWVTHILFVVVVVVVVTTTVVAFDCAMWYSYFFSYNNSRHFDNFVIYWSKPNKREWERERETRFFFCKDTFLLLRSKLHCLDWHSCLLCLFSYVFFFLLLVFFFFLYGW